ncbi:MAG: aminotransferase class I/II-fold pyridoxal phosphate-dependent enzyme [Candidatus Omnitrophica bacterium]|nr:MAG: putative N-acetyl-LL-diaminopimelate aminotransferase [Candidatus Hinthialibacteria bacterium OLB16]MBE7489079.1 aminotransferase class I/II-fold pyridoxal phosphate-dependent enzyme [bacterium]MBW7937408.1 aminotransferase class I/II-fold pyridoxal phosphate-dependent enzyme [Candidatus Omnitrophota bacterium]MCE7907352.1 aminotransferase class I/II-fold pyridoxal phosphate-dependent enzyme [Candidatus Omnitrophica bacterium COP1]MBV6480882.1 putative N-acetyl-LL-diaminopimelate aminot
MGNLRKGEKALSVAVKSLPIESKKPSRPRISRRVENLKPSGIRRFFDLVLGRADILSLGVGEPDSSTPWGIREQGIFSLEKGHTSYTSNQGYLPFRQAIARWIEREMHVSYSPEKEILVTVGVSEALDLACRALLEPDDEVLIPEPCFVSYPALVELAGGVPVLVPTYADAQFLPSIEDLERNWSPRTKALIVNFPGNPTGAIIEPEYMKEIAHWVINKDLVLISDEIYSSLTYDTHHTCFSSMPGMKERTILLHGLSKAWAMTGWRIGFAAAPDDILAAMTKIHQYQIMCAGITGQMAGIEALDHGDDECRRMKDDYARRRRFIVKSLNEMGLSCHMPGGAFYVFPSIRSTGMTSEQFALRLLEEQAVAVVPGDAFGPSGEGFVRCSYATSLDVIEKAMEKMKAFMGSLQAR